MVDSFVNRVSVEITAVLVDRLHEGRRRRRSSSSCIKRVASVAGVTKGVFGGCLDG